MKRILTIAVLTTILLFTLSAVALADDPPAPPAVDEISPIDARMLATGEYYNYDTGQFEPADEYSLHEGEADDPYHAPSVESVKHATGHAGTYVLPDGLQFVLDFPNGVPTVWF